MDKRIINVIKKTGSADARVIIIEERYEDESLEYKTKDKGRR